MAADKRKSLIMALRLKELRTEKGLSHEALRKALMDKYEIDISVDSLKNYEVSKIPHAKAYKNEGMRVEYLRCLADFFGVSADYLLGISDIKSQDSDIRAVTQATGLAENSAAVLCYARQLADMLNNAQSPKAAPCTRLAVALAERLSLSEYIEQDEDFEDGVEYVATLGNYMPHFIDDLIDACASYFTIMEDYISLLNFSGKSIELDDSASPEEFNAAASLLARCNLIALSPSEYVCLKSNEIGKFVGFHFEKKYMYEKNITDPYK